MAHSVAGIGIKNSHPVWDIGQFGKFGHENTLVESGPGRCTRLHGVQTNTIPSSIIRGKSKKVLKSLRHCYLKDLISEALPDISTSVINNTLGSSFGLRCQVALGIHLVPVNPTNVWSIYVQACLYCSSSFLDGKKFRSSWKPDWGCFDTRM